MKKITSLTLTLAFILAFTLLPSPILAQYSGTSGTSSATATTSTTSTTSVAVLEAKLVSTQKELIVVLNKMIAALKTEYVAIVEGRIRNSQLQVVDLLKKKVTLLEDELERLTQK